MTTITFDPTTETQSVSWVDDSIWSPAVVPDGADVDVVLPVIYLNQNPYAYFVTVGSGENYSVQSLEMEAEYLEIDGRNRI
jgi:hypothetical protein